MLAIAIPCTFGLIVITMGLVPAGWITWILVVAVIIGIAQGWASYLKTPAQGTVADETAQDRAHHDPGFGLLWFVLGVLAAFAILIIVAYPIRRYSIPGRWVPTEFGGAYIPADGALYASGATMVAITWTIAWLVLRFRLRRAFAVGIGLAGAVLGLMLLGN